MDAGSGGQTRPQDDGGPPGGGGSTHLDAGCSAGGLESVFGTGGLGAGGAFPGTGGGIGNLPTCPVDANGYASVDQPTMCGQYRCAAKLSGLIAGASCLQRQPGDPSRGMTLLKGCGYQWLTIVDPNATYTAVYDDTGETLVAA